MDTYDCIRTRRTTRSYLKKDIPDEVIKKILEAGRLAPSAMNLQPWDFVVVKNKETLKKLGSLCSSGRFIADASFAICVVTDPSNKWHEIDGARAVQNMALCAWNEGIGTCWVGNIEREKVKELLSIPKKFHVLTVLPFGYAVDTGGPRRKVKKRPEEIIHWERFGEK
jgi:nitroreductase